MAQSGNSSNIYNAFAASASGMTNFLSQSSATRNSSILTNPNATFSLSDVTKMPLGGSHTLDMSRVRASGGAVSGSAPSFFSAATNGTNVIPTRFMTADLEANGTISQTRYVLYDNSGPGSQNAGYGVCNGDLLFSLKDMKNFSGAPGANMLLGSNRRGIDQSGFTTAMTIAELNDVLANDEFMTPDDVMEKYVLSGVAIGVSADRKNNLGYGRSFSDNGTTISKPSTVTMAIHGKVHTWGIWGSKCNNADAVFLIVKVVNVVKKSEEDGTREQYVLTSQDSKRRRKTHLGTNSDDNSPRYRSQIFPWTRSMQKIWSHLPSGAYERKNKWKTEEDFQTTPISTADDTNEQHPEEEDLVAYIDVGDDNTQYERHCGRYIRVGVIEYAEQARKYGEKNPTLAISAGQYRQNARISLILSIKLV